MSEINPSGLCLQPPTLIVCNGADLRWEHCHVKALADAPIGRAMEAARGQVIALVGGQLQTPLMRHVAGRTFHGGH